MSMTDPIADMLTRIRNAAHAQHRSVDMPSSKMKLDIVKILKDERFVSNFRVIEDEKQGILRVYLRYLDKGQNAITGIERVSTPGLRAYVSKNHIPRVAGGFGIAVISTSRGVVTDKQARRLGVGGEVVCRIW
ncbi:30S ribosomal protein S8 [Candidatus Fermentibacteria bacterium]|nr:30S ribosomal protein S8 [Candidatus Fermentibacteria bacterium]